MPRISIGIPTYNRPDLLELVLQNFRNQTFSDFELIISDNASPDPKVRQLCERYVATDSRFRYVCHETNRGAEANFWYVYDQSSAPFFLWASDDDLWPLNFLEAGIAALEQKPASSGWFCQVVNIDISGSIIREYPSFQRFQSTRFKFIDLARFLCEPEIMGKANLIYSIFRRDALREVIPHVREIRPSWGIDMNWIYGFLCRFDLIIDDGLVLQKRVQPGAEVDPSGISLLRFPWEERSTYFRNYRKAAMGSGYVTYTTFILTLRLVYGYFSDGRWKQDFRPLHLLSRSVFSLLSRLIKR